MKKAILLHLLCSIMWSSCTPKDTAPPQSFEGDYVLPEYHLRSEGYDWTAVTIQMTTDSTAHILIRSRADIKKPSCTYSGMGTLTPSKDTLISIFDHHPIYFTLPSPDTLEISSPSPLYYFCSGGGTLSGSYIRLAHPLDETQLQTDTIPTAESDFDR